VGGFDRDRDPPPVGPVAAGAQEAGQDGQPTLARLLFTDRDQHRPLPAVSAATRQVAALSLAHHRQVHRRKSAQLRLAEHLTGYYPAAAAIASRYEEGFAHRDVRALLRAAPTPGQGRTLTRADIIALLHSAGRRRQLEDRADTLRADLRQDRWRDHDIEETAGTITLLLVEELDRSLDAEQSLQAALEAVFAAHPLAPTLVSFPGLATVLGARLLTHLGDQIPDQFPTPAALRAYTGMAPVTIASGTSLSAVVRRTRGHTALRDTCRNWAFSALTPSPGARQLYDHRRAVGDRHDAALRRVGYRLVSCLWHCLTHGRHYDEDRAWPS
jgi:hypothetical protein